MISNEILLNSTIRKIIMLIFALGLYNNDILLFVLFHPQHKRIEVNENTWMHKNVCI